MENETEVLQTTRFDRNIAYNILDMNMFSDTAPLVRSMIVYIAFQYNNTKDLFKFGKLDPYDFCHKMGFDRANLFRNIVEIGSEEDKKLLENTNAKTNPALRVKQIPTHIVNGKTYKMDTLFEYALNQLLLYNIPLSFGGFTSTGKEQVSLKSIKILDQIDIVFQESTGGAKYSKRLYLYQPNEVFLQNLARVYVNINVGALPHLRKAGSDSLYFYLLSLRDIMIHKKEPATPNFDMLCKLAGAACTSPTDNKKKILKKINDIKETSGLDISLIWAKKGKFNYQPVIHFDNIKCKSETEIKAEKTEIFNTVYIRKLQKLYDIYLNKLKKGENTLVFNDYIKTNTINRKEKATEYVSVYNLVFCSDITINHNIIVNTFGRF